MSAATVVSLDPTTDPRWAQLVCQRRSDVFHSPAWLRVLRDTYDLTMEARVSLDAAGAPTAGIVHARIDDIMDRRTVSLPFSDFCDPVVSTSEEWSALADELLAPGLRHSTRCLHSPIPLSDPRLSQVGRARWHAVDLDRPLDEIWEHLDPSARRSIRKARKHGIEVRAGEGLGDVRAFFELHLGVRRHKYGLLAQPWRFFERIWEHLLAPGGGQLLLAERDGRLLGGVLFLEWAGTLYYKFNASSVEALDVRPNDVVVWEAIKQGVESGRRRLDFGVSDWDQEGLVRFKRKYATEERTVHSLQHVPDGGPSAHEVRARELLSQITDLFTDPAVPDAVTERAGDLLYGYFT